MPQFLLLVYNDTTLLDALPAGEADGMMRDCLAHADELTEKGKLLGYQQLEGPETARSVRIRRGKVNVFDGPYAEAKEMLGGFNLVEAEDMEEAVRMAAEFPWAQTGCIEVRPIRDIGAVRQRVGAPEAVRANDRG
jgi:hypothetical protein